MGTQGPQWIPQTLMGSGSHSGSWGSQWGIRTQLGPEEHKGPQQPQGCLRITTRGPREHKGPWGPWTPIGPEDYNWALEHNDILGKTRGPATSRVPQDHLKGAMGSQGAQGPKRDPGATMGPRDPGTIMGPGDHNGVPVARKPSDHNMAQEPQLGPWTTTAP